MRQQITDLMEKVESCLPEVDEINEESLRPGLDVTYILLIRYSLKNIQKFQERDVTNQYDEKLKRYLERIEEKLPRLLRDKEILIDQLRSVMDVYDDSISFKSSIPIESYKNAIFCRDSIEACFSTKEEFDNGLGLSSIRKDVEKLDEKLKSKLQLTQEEMRENERIERPFYFPKDIHWWYPSH